MISRESFKDAIEFIVCMDSALNDLEKLFNRYDNILQDGSAPVFNSEIIVKLLNDSFKLPVSDEVGSDLEYWLYECDFGKEWNDRGVENLDLPENHKYRKPVINNLDDLYDYLKWIHDCEVTKELLGEIVDQEKYIKS